MGKKKLTDEQVMEIRRRAPSEGYEKLSDEFGVSQSLISYIKTGKRRHKGAGQQSDTR